jgi:hypothetical protein
MNVRRRRATVWGLVAVVVAFFVAGVVWRALNPGASENPDEDAQLVSRQDGYYLCLHRAQMSPGEMYKLLKRKLPKDDQVAALRGCQEAQNR